MLTLNYMKEQILNVRFKFWTEINPGNQIHLSSVVDNWTGGKGEVEYTAEGLDITIGKPLETRED